MVSVDKYEVKIQGSLRTITRSLDIKLTIDDSRVLRMVEQRYWESYHLVNVKNDHYKV